MFLRFHRLTKVKQAFTSQPQRRRHKISTTDKQLCSHVEWPTVRSLFLYTGREFTVLVNTLNFQWRDFVYSAKEITVTKQTRFKLNESGENLIVRGPFKNWSILKRLSKYVLVNHVELAVKHCTEMLFEFP